MGVIVLRRGDSIFPIKITCLHCGSVLNIEQPKDLVIAEESSVKTPSFICPVCGKQSALYEADRDQALFEYFKV